MRKWTQAVPTKALLIVLAMATALFMGFGVSVIGSLVAENIPIASMAKQYPNATYEESEVFRNSMVDEASYALDRKLIIEEFEVEGKYAPKKIVDIQAYVEEGQITNKNTSGIAYYLEDLLKLSNQEEYRMESVVTCQAAEGKYSYYTIAEFESKFIDGSYRFAEKDISQGDLIAMLRQGDMYSYGEDFSKVILDELGNVVYVDFWYFDHIDLAAEIKPLGFDNILEIANKKNKWNGRLAELYNLIEEARYRFQADYSYYRALVENERYDSNLSFIYAIPSENRVITNLNQSEKGFAWEKEIESLKNNPDNKYIFLAYQDGKAEFYSNIEGINQEQWSYQYYLNETGEDFQYVVAVDTNFEVSDIFALQQQFYNEVIPKMPNIFWGTIISFILMLVAIIWLTTVAGHVNGKDEIQLSLFDKIPTEIAATGVFVLWILCIRSIGYSALYDYSFIGPSGAMNSMAMFFTGELLIVFILAFMTITLFLIGFLSLARRIKAKTLWKNSVLCWGLRLCKKCAIYLKMIFDNRTCTFKVILAFGAFAFLHWIAIAFVYSNGGIIIIPLFIFEMVVLYFLMKDAMGRQKVRKSLQEMVKGDIHLQIPTDSLKGTNLEIAEEINSLGKGLEAALEESLKSERLKTELITNVSHDIKTPLTSIINYVDLLKREKFDDPKIQGYLDVLESKALRLKNLTEDVTEASKISTGNISLEKININFVELINQVHGEFSEGFEKRSLQAIIDTPKEEVVIYADGRRMWRVLENIFGNAGKYAMPGTRIYGDLKEQGEQVEFTLKNISENPLNISADELAERFTRGDEARNTEGSGLGLSIAQSLVEMQGGSFKIELDGDLFKIILSFPKMKVNEDGSIHVEAQETDEKSVEEMQEKEKTTIKDRAIDILNRVKSIFSKSK